METQEEKAGEVGDAAGSGYREAMLVRGVEAGKYYDRWWWVEYLRGVFGKENEIMGEGATRWYRSRNGVVVGYRTNWGLHPATFLFGMEVVLGGPVGRLDDRERVLGRVAFSFENVDEICGVLEAIGSGDLALCVGVEWFERVLEVYAKGSQTR